MNNAGIIAIIPARGGSKGIPLKNIRDFCGRPLLHYQIMNGLNSKATQTIVSTDSGEIADVASKWCQVLMRPLGIRLSGDKSKTEDSLLHALDTIPADIVVLLQATSPLTRVEHINQCIDLVCDGYDSASCFTEDYGFFHDDWRQIIDRPMRQDKKPRLRETGCCFVTRADVLKNTNNRCGAKHGIVLVSKEEAVEIDDWSDWRIAEALMRKDSYFKTREIPQPDFEMDYWGVITDPDGFVRDLGKEREKKLAWHGSILSYVNSLSGKVLDIGCGLGHILSGFHDGFDKYGVEISDYAREKAGQYGTIVRDTSAFEDNTFDVVTMINVIEHLFRPEELVGEIWRVLKPGGKLIIETADFESALAQRFGDNYRMYHDKTHTTLITLLGLHRLLLNNLFEVEKVEYPYFDTEYFTGENLMRVFDTSRVSPPFPGNIFTMFCYKK